MESWWEFRQQWYETATMCNADDREGKSVQTLQDLPNKICQMQHKYLHLSHLTGVRDFSFLWLF